jgi:hypothetical protein
MSETIENTTGPKVPEIGFVKAVTPEMPPADTLASTAPEVASGTYDEVVSTVAEPAYTASTKKKNKKSN